MRSTPSTLLRPAAVLLFVIVLFASVAAQAADLTVTVPLDVPRVDQRISVDGALNEAAWQQAGSIELPLILYRPEKDPSDLSGTARFFWNDAGLHVGVTVTDNHLYFTDDPTELEKFDSVEVWIGNFWIQVSPGESGAVLRSRFLNGFPRFTHEIDAAATRTSNGYTVELVVSKATIEAFAENPFVQGATHRFAVGLTDKDSEEQRAEPVLYFPDRFGWNNLASMALATLK